MYTGDIEAFFVLVHAVLEHEQCFSFSVNRRNCFFILVSLSCQFASKISVISQDVSKKTFFNLKKPFLNFTY